MLHLKQSGAAFRQQGHEQIDVPAEAEETLSIPNGEQPIENSDPARNNVSDQVRQWTHGNLVEIITVANLHTCICGKGNENAGKIFSFAVFCTLLVWQILCFVTWWHKQQVRHGVFLFCRHGLSRQLIFTIEAMELSAPCF